jgi:hypothetical protein
MLGLAGFSKIGREWAKIDQADTAEYVVKL